MILFFTCFTFLTINCIGFYLSEKDCKLCKFYNHLFDLLFLKKHKNANLNLAESKKTKLHDNLKLLEFISNYEQYLNTNNLSNSTTTNKNSESKKNFKNRIEDLYSLKYSTQKSILNTAFEIKIYS